MKFKLKGKQTTGTPFKEGDFITLSKEFKDKRQYFVGKDAFEKKVLILENSEDAEFNTIKDLTKFLKSNDVKYTERDLNLIKFEVTKVENGFLVIEGEINELFRGVKFKGVSKVGKIISNVTVHDLVNVGLENGVFDLKVLDNLSKVVNLEHLDPTLIKGYVSSHDGREVTFRLDEVEQTLNYYKKLEDDYNKKAEQVSEEECQLLVLDDLPNLSRKRHLLNSGDELTLDEELREYLSLTSLDLCTKVKVVTGTKYVFGEKHYLVKLEK